MSKDLGSLTATLTGSIERANESFQMIWRTIVGISIDLGETKTNSIAIRRLLSYNPDYAKGNFIQQPIRNSVNFLSEIITKAVHDVQSFPDNPTIWVLLGKCYLLLQDFPNAYSSFAHVIRIKEEISDPYYWFSIACTNHHFHFYEDSESFYKKTLEKNPNFPLKGDFYMRRGMLSRSRGLYQESIGFFNQSLNCLPGNLTEDDIHFHIAFTYQCSNDFKKAIPIYSKLFQKYPDSYKLLHQYVWALSLSPEVSNLNLAESIIQSYPKYSNDSTLNFVLGRIFLIKGELDLAYNRFCECIPDMSESPLYWAWLGNLYWKNDQDKDALIAYQRAVYLLNDFCEVWLNMGLIYEKNHDIERAAQVYDIGIKTCSNNAILIQHLKRLNERKENEIRMMEITESKYFTQIAEKHEASILNMAPPLPGNCISPEYEIQKGIESIHTRYDSLFL